MSLSHYNYTSASGENSSVSEGTQHKNEYEKYHLHNMYNEEAFINPHDIAGTKGIVKTQMDEIENKKVQFRMTNEFYLRKHPEINKLIMTFLFKTLDDKPQDILGYAGKFFDNPKLKEIVEVEHAHYTGNDEKNLKKK